MSSINFNQSASVALNTLRSINKDLSTVQAQISTGKRIDSARDNASVWAISKVMSADVSGFKTITDSLNLGSATVGVARAAAEQISTTLEDLKGLIISAQDQNQDREKIQTEIEAKVAQVKSIADGAQFNGLNLLKGAGDIDIVASLDRSTSGVSSSSISVARYDLSQNEEYFDLGGTFMGAIDYVGLNDVTQTDTLTVGEIIEGRSYSINIDAEDANSSTFDPAFETTMPHTTASSASIYYIPKSGDTATDVAAGLAAAYAEYATANSIDTNTLNITASGGELTVTSTVTTAADTITVFLDTVDGDHVADGGLLALKDIDVTTDEGATAALTSIESAIQASIDAAAAFGSAQGRIETQIDFVDELTSSLNAGISALTDTDMEEASARLQSLQVQQQLGVQALSIANSSPQSILSLFRG